MAFDPLGTQHGDFSHVGSVFFGKHKAYYHILHIYIYIYIRVNVPNIQWSLTLRHRVSQRPVPHSGLLVRRGVPIRPLLRARALEHGNRRAAEFGVREFVPSPSFGVSGAKIMAGFLLVSQLNFRVASTKRHIC